MTDETKQRSNREIQDANLLPFKPGQSGNPNGRPKSSVTALLKATPDVDKKIIADKLTEIAKKGDLKAIDMFIDRTDGKPAGEEPVQGDRILNIIVDNEQGKSLMLRLIAGEPHGGLIEEGK